MFCKWYSTYHVVCYVFFLFFSLYTFSDSRCWNHIKLPSQGYKFFLLTRKKFTNYSLLQIHFFITSKLNGLCHHYWWALIFKSWVFLFKAQKKHPEQPKSGMHLTLNCTLLVSFSFNACFFPYRITMYSFISRPSNSCSPSFSYYLFDN